MKLKVAAAALNTTPIDWAWNRAHIQAALHEAQARGVQLACLPELCVTGYGCEDLFFRAHVRETALATALAIARETAVDLTYTLGLPLEWQGGLYNAVAVVSGRRIRGFFAKQNLAGDGVHYEPRWFKPWPRELVVDFALGDGTTVPLGDTAFTLLVANEPVSFGFEICEDAWVADRPGVALSKAAIDIILNPSASHFAFGKTRTRERFVIDGSRAFNCAYVYANLLGNEAGRIVYDGECLVANGGELIAKGRRFGFGGWRLTEATLDLGINRTARLRSASFKGTPRTFFPAGETSPTAGPTTLPQPAPRLDPWENEPAFQDVPVAELAKLAEFLAVEALALFDYSRKTRTRGFVISKSGGADSALCAVLVHEMIRVGYGLPDDREAFLAAYPETADLTPAAANARLLTLIYQGTANSSAATLAAAEAVARDLGARFVNISVQQIVDFAETTLGSYLGRSLDWQQDDLTRQNLQARARALLPWTIANAENKLNVTTSNRSEAAVGYCTMDGDTAGSIGPLGGIDKKSVLQFLDLLARIHPGIALVRAQPPTAELKPAAAGQTDEKDLMPYAVLDEIEKFSILHGKSPAEAVAENIATPWQVAKFFTLFPRNQWKRERYAPSFMLDNRNLDPRSFMRFPILNGGFRDEIAALPKSD